MKAISIIIAVIITIIAIVVVAMVTHGVVGLVAYGINGILPIMVIIGAAILALALAALVLDDVMTELN